MKEEIFIITLEEIEGFNRIISNITGKKANGYAIISQWERNKEKLYQSFLDFNTVISFPIAIELTPQEKEKAREKFIARTYICQNILRQIDSNSLITNRLQKPLVIEGHRFLTGMRVSKVLKKLIENPVYYTELENSYSSFLQSFKIRGEGCISISPLDFLTMSENGHNWRSCHSLTGDAKAGPLSLMTDPYTAIIYIKSFDTFDFQGVKVSNKKWRSLIHINPEVPYVVFNTQYPFISDTILNIFQKKVIEILKSSYPNENFVSDFKNSNDIYRIIKEVGDLHYNDLLSISLETMKFTDKKIAIILPQKEKYKKDLPSIKIGNIPICPVCSCNTLTSRSFLQCHICKPIPHCQICGDDYDEMFLYKVEGGLYCDFCYDTEFTYCENCDALIRRKDLENHRCFD